MNQNVHLEIYNKPKDTLINGYWKSVHEKGLIKKNQQRKTDKKKE